MNVRLLFPDREWKGVVAYFDSNSIVNDLGLHVLFQSASRDQERSEGNVQTISAADSHLSNVLKRVMMVPLENAEEIYYRQEIMADCFQNQQFLHDLYDSVKDLMSRWEKLGKKEMNKPGARGKTINLVADVKVFHLFVNTLTKIKQMCRENRQQFQSRGLMQFAEEMEAVYSDEWEEKIRKVLEDITFYSDGEEEYSLTRSGAARVHQAKIVFECTVADGLKLGTIKVDSVETLDKRYRKVKAKKTVSEKLVTALASEPTTIIKDPILLEELQQMQSQVVKGLIDCFQPFLMECKEFFEELYVQVAFYRACYNLYIKTTNLGLTICYPKVCAKDCLRFENLTEFGMAMYRNSLPVGNTCAIDNKKLLIVTGANQGGKSTFLRSIGLAQVMLQCGMFVSAKSFESGIYKYFFTHFTRREDSAMNSGRLDEELGRIDQIIRHLGKDSMVLLNESFATTTEEEGSVIAYDIVKALVEADVKILTVTHLLSFAKKVYGEQREDVEFLSAQRMSDGKRTYKMVPNEPELTSFGLDLYEKIILE